MSFKLILTFIFVLIIILLMIFYFIPFNVINFEAKPENYNFSTIQNESRMQFYSNMRFPDSEISYRILDCPLQKINDMEFAFDIMGNITSLKFYQVNNNEEISIRCDERNHLNGGLFIAGEGGPSNITQAGEFHVILNGGILLIKESDCPKPNVALHELLHVLGFEHSSNKENIMYNVTNCDQIIGEDMIQLINELYSIPSYPDLAFENVSAVMSGRFININMTIMNIGLNNAGESKIIIYADGNVLKEIDLESLGIGYGTIISMENIWISQIKVNELDLIIKTDFNEINKENNKIKLKIKE
ncbi:MAG TPA: matrixin family metalloprotease [Candidatus Nanoarchaeia archaeon]|nr:matrixin family metalloprotease [Candidatus Nanoarchaeia archaeon]